MLQNSIRSPAATLLATHKHFAQNTQINQDHHTQLSEACIMWKARAEGRVVTAARMSRSLHVITEVKQPITRCFRITLSRTYAGNTIQRISKSSPNLSTLVCFRNCGTIMERIVGQDCKGSPTWPRMMCSHQSIRPLRREFRGLSRLNNMGNPPIFRYQSPTWRARSNTIQLHILGTSLRSVETKMVRSRGVYLNLLPAIFWPQACRQHFGHKDRRRGWWVLKSSIQIL